MGQPKGEMGNRHMKTQRKTYSAEFKSKIAVEAIRGIQTINELATE
jgi:transposase-like protein